LLLGGYLLAREHPRACLDELLIQRFLLGFLLLHLASQLPVQRLSHLPRRAQPGATSRLDVRESILHQPFGAPHEAGKHAHAIYEQTYVGRMVNGLLHTRGTQPQLAPPGHLRLPGYLHDSIVEPMHRLGVQRLLPAP
jgi:hypothetical protein